MTGQHLKIRRMGDDVLGVDLKGDPSKPEPTSFRVTLPGGADVDITRTTEGRYWVHINTGTGGLEPGGKRRPARIVDGRVDVLGKHAVDCACGDLGNPDAYHAAILIDPQGRCSR